jgi:carboxymethylenebutenolidase
MIGKLEAPKVTAQAVEAVRWLKSNSKSNGKVGAVGFCWGGGVVNRTAVAAGSDLAAGVPYYGAQPKAEDVPKIKAEMLMHYAGEDERINAGIPAYKDALAAAGVKNEIHTYPGAQHAFNNDTSDARYGQGGGGSGLGRPVGFVEGGVGLRLIRFLAKPGPYARAFAFQGHAAVDLSLRPRIKSVGLER